MAFPSVFARRTWFTASLDDRAVDGVLEQVERGDGKVAGELRHDAEQDPDEIVFRVGPVVGRGVAEMAERAWRLQDAISPEAVAGVEQEETVTVAASLDLEFHALAGPGIDQWPHPGNRGVDLLARHGGHGGGTENAPCGI